VRGRLGSGFKFPVPWHKIPENIYLNIRMINALLLTPGLSAKKAVLRDRGIKEPINLLGMHRTDVPWITMNTEGASVPVDYVPPNVTSVGPILMDSAPAAEQDPELAQWLKKAPTIIFNPGSHFLVSIDPACCASRHVKSRVSDMLLLGLRATSQSRCGRPRQGHG
jgi:hypothetical protein